MNKWSSLQLKTKHGGGEYYTVLGQGDIFLSFHHPSENIAAVYIKKFEYRDEVLAKIKLEIEKYFNCSLHSLSVKIIACQKSQDLLRETPFVRSFASVKDVIREGQVEVIFLPEQSKVRVSIENKAEPKVSTISAVAKPIKNEKVNVLIVDDSKTIRTILAKIFSSDERFNVCAMAEKPSEVAGLIEKHQPDVITLDIHMPEMDGVTLLKQIAPKYGIPTVMISSISMAEGPLVLEALENGAVDYIQKPEASEIEKVTPLILEKVKTAAAAKLNRKVRRERSAVVKTKELCNMDSLIVLGSSTGGTEAIRDILMAMPNQIPPMLIVQHIPAVFSAAFAKRMNDLCPFEVKEAADGDEVKANRVLIAPGGKQMKLVVKSDKKVCVEINDDDPVNRFKPSVDYLFFSAAKVLYTHTIAVILTGMGKDGAKGMLELKKSGVRTIAQDEDTSIVFGMPKEAINIGAAEHVVALPMIAEKIVILTNDRYKNKKRNAS